MDLLGYAAMGGLERVAIVAGAVIIGYWGYRLYTTEKQAGLVFMGLAVLVLIGSLATGSSYQRSVTESYQLASAAIPGEPASATTEADEPQTAGAEEMADAELANAASDSSDPSGTRTAEAAASATVDRATDSPFLDEQPLAPATVDRMPESDVPAELASATDNAELPVDDADSPARLATGQELGGRIMSVKSENVSLEWSSGSD